MNFMDKEFIGTVSMIDGRVWFQGGMMSYIALKLLAEWLENNVE